MGVCRPTKSDVDPDSREQLLAPRKLFREEESRSCVTHLGKSTRSKPPYATEDTDEGRTARTKAWVSNVANHGVSGEIDEELAEQDMEIRLRKNECVNNHDIRVSRGGEQSEAHGMAESSPASWQKSRHSVISVDPRMARKPSEAPEVAEPSPASRRRGGHNANPRMARSTSEAPGAAESSPASWQGSRHSVISREPRLARRPSEAYGVAEWSPISRQEGRRSVESRLEQGLKLVSPGGEGRVR